MAMATPAIRGSCVGVTTRVARCAAMIVSAAVPGVAPVVVRSRLVRISGMWVAGHLCRG